MEELHPDERAVFPEIAAEPVPTPAVTLVKLPATFFTPTVEQKSAFWWTFIVKAEALSWRRVCGRPRPAHVPDGLSWATILEIPRRHGRTEGL
jgi:hypothetical protein